MQQTTNFKLNLPEGSDLFAPMHDFNPNWSAIDNQMQLNRLSSMQEADCIFAGGVFQLTRKVKGSTFFRFTAPADYTAGNTFTVDGEVFTAGLAGNFATLPDGAFTNGNIVVAYLDAGDAKKMALMTGSSPLPKDIDAKTLEGHGADYFATAQALEAVNSTATSAGNAVQNALTKAQNAFFRKKIVWTNPNPSIAFGAQEVQFTTPLDPGNFATFQMVQYRQEASDGTTHRYTCLYPNESISYPSSINLNMRAKDGSLLIFNRDATFTSKKAIFSDAFGTSITGGNVNSVGVNNSMIIPETITYYYQREV